MDGVSTPTTAGVVPLAAKGQLRPDGPFSISRHGLDDAFAEVARQIWIPRWQLPEGVVHEQPILNYPALNVVIEPRTAAVHFPSTALGRRELAGTGWAVGVLLRPGAGWLVAPVDHSTMTDAELPIPDVDELSAADLIADVRAVMTDSSAPEPSAVDAAASACVESWLRPLIDRVDDQVMLVNALCDAVEHDPALRTPADLVDLFDVSERTLQRLLRTRVGVTPSWLFQRRRLQEAAFRLREEPGSSLADLASELGYADQAHFTRDFRAVVGESPGRYRSSHDTDPPN